MSERPAPAGAHSAGRGARRAVVLGGARTPFARSGGAFEPLRADDLGRLAMVAALARVDVPPDEIDAVVFGCAGMPSDAANPARVAALRAGVPARVGALTVQRNCGSGLEAVVQAATLVEMGQADVVLCGGMESMTNYPAELPRSFRRKAAGMLRARSGLARARVALSFRPSDFRAEWALRKGLNDPTCGLGMGETAEVLARELGIGRAEQDAFALRSHARATAARERLAREIAPVFVPESEVAVLRDDAVREDQSLERLGRLKPAFARTHGTVTPGNACGVTDGACGLVVAEEGWARRHLINRAVSGSGDAPLVHVRSWSVAGVAPERMGLGPAAALPRALAAAGWRLDELDLVEINEAFAVQVLACQIVLASPELMRRHAGWEEAPGAVAEDRLNVNGGAIALGHPVGTSGARLVLTLAREMAERGLARGAASLCVGGGQGMALLLEAG